MRAARDAGRTPEPSLQGLHAHGEGGAARGRGAKAVEADHSRAANKAANGLKKLDAIDLVSCGDVRTIETIAVDEELIPSFPPPLLPPPRLRLDEAFALGTGAGSERASAPHAAGGASAATSAGAG